jgi:hypothetical protein
MRYIQMARKSQNIITIGEYIHQRQPKVFKILFKRFKLHLRDVTELILVAADISGADKQYQYLMQERPKGGRGGLLPWEKEEDLW